MRPDTVSSSVDGDPLRSGIRLRCAVRFSPFAGFGLAIYRRTRVPAAPWPHSSALAGLNVPSRL